MGHHSLTPPSPKQVKVFLLVAFSEADRSFFLRNTQCPRLGHTSISKHFLWGWCVFIDFSHLGVMRVGVM